jgi:alpha-ribazole phosphatase/probable phosphoglycerate mutase
VSRLVLVRHAEPEEDARGRCYGSLDVGLSDAGRHAAAALAERLAELAYDAVWSSPRLRAVDTATPIAEARRLVVTRDDDLRELDFGALEGRAYDEIAESEPDLFRAWMERPTTLTFPGGEGFADLKQRALAACRRIRRTHERAVVVTHGGVVRAALAEWLGMPDEAIFRLDQRYCGVTIVDWVEDVPAVRLVNGVPW